MQHGLIYVCVRVRHDLVEHRGERAAAVVLVGYAMLDEGRGGRSSTSSGRPVAVKQRGTVVVSRVGVELQRRVRCPGHLGCADEDKIGVGGRDGREGNVGGGGAADGL